ncbi:ACP S-malonyltransferase [Actinomadura sp. NTSP31]|uniref:ACP S-malonyltransferase n=1 Tax=Actinomadura sp. NTSP31 TaxID=1735447 RepID=UPI0035BFB463
MTTAFVFSGQGAQRAGMAGYWADDPAAARLFAAASDVLGHDLAAAASGPGGLGRTEVAQPLLFVCGVAAHRALGEHGVRPGAVAGHSLGEFAALVAAGALDFEEALAVVARRAAAMSAACAAAPGAMCAVVGPDAAELAAAACALREPGETLVVANRNGPRQVVLSGTGTAVARAEAAIGSRGGRAVRLKVEGAFHSPLMEPASRALAAALADLTWHAPDCWVIPNVTGEPTRDHGLLAELLGRHLLSPVQWARTAGALIRLGTGRVVECGPKPVLTALLRGCGLAASYHLADSPAAVRTAAEALQPVA